MTPTQLQVYLRTLEEGDLERTYRWHNDPELYSTLVDGFRFVSRNAEHAWLAARTSYSTAEVNLAICLAPGGEHIGNLYLRPINLVSRNAALGIFIGEKNQRGRGFGRQALYQALRHGFSDLGLERVYLEVLADNARAVRLYELVGFRTEGRLRSHVFKNGEFRDVLVMGILRSDFMAGASEEDHG
jgi:RimJ/RimL family protein N-acetyltransferase